MSLAPPPHDKRIKGPKGVKRRPVGAIVHTTEMGPRKGSGDRHDIIDFLARNKKSVPVVADPGGGSTIMCPLGYLGAGHARGLTGKAWGIEQVGFARWPRKAWLKGPKREMVRTAAQWAAWVLAELMDLPVTEKNLKRFIVGHDKDHKLGGSSDHWDPGPGYPWDVFRADAIAYAGEKVPATKPKKGKPKPKPKMVTRYRIVATKDDRKVAKNYRVRLPKRAWKWAAKRARAGWRITIGRRKPPGH